MQQLPTIPHDHEERLDNWRSRSDSLGSGLDDQEVIFPGNHDPRRLQSITWKVIYLGCVFAVIFTSGVVQSFLTTLFPGLGYLALGIMQLCFAVGSLVAPLLEFFLSPKWMIVIGACTYPVFVAAAASESETWLIAATVINGFGAAILWIGQGIWLTRLTFSTNRIGLLTGLFFTLFNTSLVLGNLLVMLLQHYQCDFNAILWSLFFLAALGSTMTLVVPTNDPHSKQMIRLSVKRILIPLLHVGFSKKMLLLLPYMLCQGATLSFAVGNLPYFARGDAGVIVKLVLAFGIVSCFIALVSGKIVDRLGMMPLLIIHTLLAICQSVVLVMFVVTPPHIAYYTNKNLQSIILILLGASYGLLVFLINTLTNVSMSMYFDTHLIPAAFSWYRFVSCLGFSFLSFLSSYIDDFWIVVVNTALAALSITCFLFFQSVVRREEERQQELTLLTRELYVSREERIHEELKEVGVASLAATLVPARPAMPIYTELAEEEHDLENHMRAEEIQFV